MSENKIKALEMHLIYKNKLLKNMGPVSLYRLAQEQILLFRRQKVLNEFSRQYKYQFDSLNKFYIFLLIYK